MRAMKFMSAIVCLTLIPLTGISSAAPAKPSPALPPQAALQQARIQLVQAFDVKDRAAKPAYAPTGVRLSELNKSKQQALLQYIRAWNRAAGQSSKYRALSLTPAQLKLMRLRLEGDPLQKLVLTCYASSGKVTRRITETLPKIEIPCDEEVTEADSCTD